MYVEGDVGDGMVIEMAENAAVVKSNIDNNGDEFSSVIKSGISTREAIFFFFPGSLICQGAAGVQTSAVLRIWHRYDG